MTGPSISAAIIPWLPSRYWFRLLIFCQSSWREIDESNCPVVDRTIQVLNFLMMINSTDIPDSTINSTIHLFLILPMFSEFNHAFPRSKSWDSLKTSSCFSCENAPARWKSSWFFLRVRIFGRWKSMSSSTENLRHRFVFKPFATPDLGSRPFFCRRARQPLSSAASSSTSPAAPYGITVERIWKLLAYCGWASEIHQLIGQWIGFSAGFRDLSHDLIWFMGFQPS